MRDYRGPNPRGSNAISLLQVENVIIDNVDQLTELYSKAPPEPPTIRSLRTLKRMPRTEEKYWIYTANSINELIGSITERKIRFLLDSNGILLFAKEGNTPAHGGKKEQEGQH